MALLPYPVPLHGGSFPLFGGGEVTLRRGLTVLVGPNGTGKTQALRAAVRWARDRVAKIAEVPVSAVKLDLKVEY